MAWLVFEVAWAIDLQYTDGFSRGWPSALTILAMIISFGFPARALKTIRAGTGYAVWTGIGSMGAATLGMILFSEPASWMRLGSIGLILAESSH